MLIYESLTGNTRKAAGLIGEELLTISNQINTLRKKIEKLRNGQSSTSRKKSR